MGLVENIQREKLGPIDESNGFKKLIGEYSLSIKEVSSLVGKSRSYVSNALRLSGLEDSIVEGLVAGEVKVGQVRPLLALDHKKTKRFLQRDFIIKSFK